MTPNATLRQRLAEWRPTSEDVLTVTDGAWTAEVQAERCETLGCLVRELTLRHAPPEGATPPGLKEWAERVAARVTGLLEPLRLLEVDDVRRTAVLRSNEPARQDDELSYYELLLDGAGTANLRRYRASRQPGVRREAVGFALTHDALAKLAGDVAASRS
jgi:hypothetical protein